jgi:heat shock protein HtpX
MLVAEAERLASDTVDGLLGDPRPMMSALARRGGLEPGALPPSMKASGITDKPSGFAARFSTHPPVEERIAALRARTAA